MAKEDLKGFIKLQQPLEEAKRLLVEVREALIYFNPQFRPGLRDLELRLEDAITRAERRDG